MHGKHTDIAAYVLPVCMDGSAAYALSMSVWNGIAAYVLLACVDGIAAHALSMSAWNGSAAYALFHVCVDGSAAYVPLFPA